VLVESFGWPWVFFINVPFGVIAILLTWAFVPETVVDKGRKLSWIGFGALAIGIGAFQLMLNRAEQLDWFASAEIVFEAGIAAIAFYVFVAHTALSRTPFVSRELFRDRNYAIALAFIFVYGSICFLQLFLIPIMLQDLAGYDIAGVAELLTWRGVGLITGMFLIGPVSDKLDPRIILVFGFACLVGSAWGMSGSTLDVRAFDVAWTNFFQGMGAGVAYIPIVLVGLATLPQAARTEAVTLIYVISNLGTATGTAVIFNYLVRNTTINRGIMSEHLSQYSDVVHLGLLPRLWSLGERGGVAAVEAMMARQAAIIAYNDAFFLIALSALAVLPLAVFVRLPKRRA
jgi:DHA2 family multidrug resistance protein